MRIPLHPAQILPSLLEPLREGDVLCEWVHGDGAVTGAVRAGAADGDALFFSFGLGGVEGWGEGHGEADCAAVAVEGVGGGYAVGCCPRWRGWGGRFVGAF